MASTFTLSGYNGGFSNVTITTKSNATVVQMNQNQFLLLNITHLEIMHHKIEQLQLKIIKF